MVKIDYKFKNDSYKKSRGGYSRLLNITCTHCQDHVCYYQKDGPGILKRLYIDRISDSNQLIDKQLLCPNCGEHLGIKIIYKKENRPAFRMFVGAISKKIIQAR